MSKKQFKDTTVGQLLFGAASVINPTLGNVLQGVTSPKEAIEAITKSDAPAEDKVKLQQIIFEQQNKEIEAITSRWQADSMSDSWMSKNVRPLVLVWCIVIFSMAGILDSSRFKLFLSRELKVPVKEIDAIVMGGHGDTMVPLPRFTKVSEKPLLDLVKEGKISSEKLESINQRTRDGGAEIVKYLEKGSAFYAPAASGVEMAAAYLNDEKKLLPCAAYMNGEYGVEKIYAGVPVIIGKNGIEKIEEVELDDKEKTEFNHSIEAVKKLWEAASAIDPDLKR